MTKSHLSRFAIAVALLLPLAASAQTRTTTAPASEHAFRIGVLPGFEFGGDDPLDSGFGIRVDGEYDLMQLGANVKLGLVGSLGWSRFSGDAGGVDSTLDIFKAVPAARFTFPLTNEFGIYGDVGLGVYYAQIEAETTFLGQTITADDDEVGLTMRFAPGLFYQLSPQLRLGAEFGVNPFFGDVDQTYFNISGMLSYRF